MISPAQTCSDSASVVAMSPLHIKELGPDLNESVMLFC